MNKRFCIICNCKLTVVTQFSHGVCISCCDENTAKAVALAASVKMRKELQEEDEE
jgi:hypothetical protein